MIRVYVAGAYSAPDVIGVLDNIRNGMRAATELLLDGYAPFVPWFDFHFQLMLRGGESLSVENYYAYSMEWLRASHAVLVLPNSGNSKGTQSEITEARKLGIPVFHGREDLDSFKEQLKERLS